MINLVYLLVIFIIYFIICSLLYNYRKNQVIIVDLDSVISNIDIIKKRAKIYIENNPNKDINDYIYEHINEQVPVPDGIKKVWDLQNKFYKIIFVSERDENLRIPTAKFLNDWNLIGELYMFGSLGDKYAIIPFLQQKGFRINGVIDWSEEKANLPYKYL